MTHMTLVLSTSDMGPFGAVGSSGSALRTLLDCAEAMRLVVSISQSKNLSATLVSDLKATGKEDVF